jgi:glycosyltransferase involved in cell wall biosynthesis
MINMTTNKKRLLFVIETLGFGGVERRRLSLSKRLCDEFDIEIVCSKTNGLLYQKFEELGIKIHCVGVLGWPWSLGTIVRTLKIVNGFRPDIIHGAVFEGVTLANIAGWFFPKAVVISEETADPQNRSKMGSNLLKILIKRSIIIIAVSASVKDYLLGIVTKPEKIIQINNGVEDRSIFDQELISSKKNELGIKENDFVIGFVGRLRDYHKRVSDLIEAADDVFEEHSILKIIIVGGGQDEKMLKEKASLTKFPSNIVFTGAQNDPNPYYACMDAFCIPSRMEAFGLVIVEAMFHRLPVIATNVGGMKEIVVNEKTGFLVPKLSPDKLAKKIEYLILNPKVLLEMGSEGRKRAIENYSAEGYVTKVRSVYANLLS